MGGGSGDAATALHAANRLCGFPVSQETLIEWGAELGSDIWPGKMAGQLVDDLGPRDRARGAISLSADAAHEESGQTRRGGRFEVCYSECRVSTGSGSLGVDWNTNAGT